MASSGIMTDSYVGGIVSSSFIQQNDDLPFCVTVTDDQQPSANEISDDKIESILFGGKTKGWEMKGGNQTDEDKIIHLSCIDEAKSTNINKTEEYNIGYSGLSILPWEEFVFNPRVFNDLFYTERNQRITYDPEEVNVFFHGKNVMPPTLGDISENGKSWNIDVDNIGDLRKIRKLLTERCSVFGVTLQYKEKRFAKPVRAPCLVLMDPNQGGIGDRLYTTLTKAIDTIHNQRRFCVEINFNLCVERWCKRVLLTDCKAVGAKLYVTNGEEYTPLNETTEDRICCALCFPIWLLQTSIYKLHRVVTYDDYRSDFDVEDLFLHGSFQDAQYQRQQIFKEAGSEEVFRTRSANQTDIKTLQDLGTYKFVCVKKVEKSEDENTFKEHNTATFSSLVDKRKVKVLHKDKKISDKKKSKNSNSNKEEKGSGDFENGNTQNLDMTKENQHDAGNKMISTNYTNEAFSSSDEEHGENDNGITPRIPEIASVLCQQDQDETAETEVPVEFEMKDDNVFMKRTDTLDQDALDFHIHKGECSDSKSMTALCSFQMSDTGSEYEVTDEEEEEYVEIQVSSSKENLIEEMKKIERTLPKLQTMATDFENKTSNDNSGKDKKGRKTKLKKRVMVGQAFRELTKTTNKPATIEKNLDDDKTQTNVENKNIETSDQENKKQGKNNTVDSKKDNEDTKNVRNEKNKTQNGDSIQQSNDAKTVRPRDIKDVGVVNEISERQTDEKGSKNEISEFDNVSNSIIQGNTVLDFNLDDLSSDGDEVEMIYQSDRSKYTVSKSKEISGAESTPLKINKKSGSDIERVAESNEPDIPEEKKHNTIVRTGTFTEIDYENTKEEVGEVNPKGTNVMKSDSKVTSTNANSNTLLNVTKVEAALDITDIDEIDEDDSKEKPNIKIPPLKLNIGETLGKKAKRGSRQYNSNRKYLGASVPSKNKRMHRE